MADEPFGGWEAARARAQMLIDDCAPVLSKQIFTDREKAFAKAMDSNARQFLEELEVRNG